MALPSAYPASRKHALNTYKVQEINTSSPGKLVLHLYDYTIKGCVRKDASQAVAGLKELIDALNFDGGGEVAVGLFLLYEYAMRSVKESAYDPPLKILRELRATWQMAMTQRPSKAVATG